ncbi:hypothetical protein [Cognataquiflexum rubidum]|uniref:hypothetical protein n=1 Tax=Cognataquiflexum rubidum TaxID=2922273 RepID=UPI001F14296E|nr:hypothetical protein [Cognataquiflexum rubidum]MCH6234198.1 hypothetical protein [Cognataquiflexum rubidum]
MKKTILILIAAMQMAYGSNTPNDLKSVSGLAYHLSSLELKITGIPRIGSSIAIIPCIPETFVHQIATLDSRLVGIWKQNQRNNSGDYSNDSSIMIGFSHDGKFNIYETNSYDLYKNQDSSIKVIATFEIFAKDDIIYLIHPEKGNLMFLSKYQINGNYLQTISEDGVKEMWVRQTGKNLL